MTTQFPESIILDGQHHDLHGDPLGQFFFLSGKTPDIDINCTGLWRGYVGTWEVVDERLYLVDLQGSMLDGSKLTLGTIFSDYPNRVFAHWYSGELHIPQGRLIERVRAGFGGVYEREIVLVARRGIVSSRRTVINRPDHIHDKSIQLLGNKK